MQYDNSQVAQAETELEINKRSELYSINDRIKPNKDNWKGCME